MIIKSSSILSALFSCGAFSLWHSNVTSHGISGICCCYCCIFMYRENTWKANFQGAVHLRPARSLSAMSNGYLMPTWCHLAPCDEANVFSRWGDIVKALERSLGFDWQALSQKMRSGGSHAAKRIYYLGWQGNAFTMCQCSQPSCSPCDCGIVPPRRNEGTAFNFNFCGCHK